MGSLEKRLEALEAAAPAIVAHSPPATQEDSLRWIYGLFRSSELWFDATGAVIVSSAKHAYGTDRALLDAAASAINDWRSQQATPAPVLPMMPDEAQQLLELLRSGHVIVNEQIHPPTYPRLEGWHKLRSADLLVASQVARDLDSALQAYQASGGTLEYTAESIMDLLTEYLNNEPS